MNRTRLTTFTVLLSATTLGMAEGDHPTHHQAGPIHAHHGQVTESAALHDDDTFGWSVTLGYDSRYVSEGRDNLDGDALAHGAVEVSFHDLLVGAWYADSPDGPYDEVNFYAEYLIGICDGIEAFIGYTHLRFPNDGGHDHEVGGGIVFSNLPLGLETGAEAYYSFDAGGTFFEGYLARTFEVADWLSLQPGVIIGFNDEYVSDGHQGANHVAATLSATVPLPCDIELAGYVSYNWAIDSNPVLHPDDAALSDFFYGGIAATFSF